MAPKSKKVTMSLNDFLKTDQVKEVGDESWADEGFVLPSGPRGMDSLPSGPSGGFGGGNDGGFGRRPGRFANDRSGGSGGGAGGAPITIDQGRLPTSPPYSVFVGNLSFDVTEADIRTFMQMRNISAASILGVKLPLNHENKSRGFGYVEFSNCDDLTRALLASNQFSIKNRVVRIDFADSKPQNDRELGPAESSRNWRDGAGATPRVMMGRHQEDREPRPLSVAESSRNWRDGAAPVERTATFSNNEGRPAVRSSVPVPEPVRNWRETAKPVEKSATSVNVEPAASEPASTVTQQPTIMKKAQSASKVPEGSWRR